MSFFQSRGLTLIEVLISSTILFAAVAVISETYRASLSASDRADRFVRLVTPMSLITSSIRESLRVEPKPQVTGTGRMLGVDFVFDARSVAFQAPPRRLDPELGEVIDYLPRYRLYDVKLNLKRAGTTRSYVYQEIAWLPEVERQVSP